MTKATEVLGNGLSVDGMTELALLRNKALAKMRAVEHPVAASFVYNLLVDLTMSGSLEYGLVWVPTIITGMGAEPDEINDALEWLDSHDYVDLYWAPGTYREDGSFDLDPSVPALDASLLRPGLCGALIGYVRVRNDHPWRNFRSAELPTWMQISSQAAKKRPKVNLPTTDAQIHDLLDAGAPLIVSWGIGRDSTAMLVQFARLGLVPDAILYAEVGNEKPETYAYRPYFERYLASVGFPRVQTVKYRVGHGKYCTLEQECLFLGALPSIAYGYTNRKCSAKWKVVPQEQFVRGMPIAQEAWRQGLPVVRAVGFDASPEDMKRRDRAVENEMFVNWYPMQEWGWDLDRVKAEISAEGLDVPVKSACFFCSASQPHEVEELAREHPEYLHRIAEIEQRGKIKSVGAEGLWFKATKDKPGSWTEFIRQYLATGVPYKPRKKR